MQRRGSKNTAARHGRKRSFAEELTLFLDGGEPVVHGRHRERSDANADLVERPDLPLFAPAASILALNRGGQQTSTSAGQCANPSRTHGTHRRKRSRADLNGYGCAPMDTESQEHGENSQVTVGEKKESLTPKLPTHVRTIDPAPHPSYLSPGRVSGVPAAIFTDTLLYSQEKATIERVECPRYALSVSVCRQLRHRSSA